MNNRILLFLFSFFTILFSCTNDFNEINEKPDALSASDVSAKFFVTNTQTGLFAPNRFPYWRGPLIHFDRYAGQHSFGFATNWWSGGLGYDYNSGYTDAVFNWMAEYNSNLTAYTNFVKEGGTLENSKYYAISLIMKGLYYQRFTDTFGMVPYSQASNPDITTPEFDSQLTIYKGILADLDQAIDLIGSDTSTGSGIDLLTDNDLFFNGDLQSWKKLANSLKLRLALRAYGATGEDFSSGAASAAISEGILVEKNALIPRDTEISQWESAVYGDIWHNFYGGGHWYVGATMIDVLKQSNDPRLTKYAKPSKGGSFTMTKPTEGENIDLFDKHIDFITTHLDNSSVVYTKTVNSEGVNIEIAADTYYIGLPARLNGRIKPYLANNLWSEPQDIVVNKKNEGKPIFPFLVMTAAESHFMVAEAIEKGLASSGTAQGHYQAGLRSIMELWDVDEASIDAFIANEDMALLNGTDQQNLEKIAIQRWLANYTNGLEAWSVIRDTGYPTELFTEVNDRDIYALGNLNGTFPQRLRYGSATYNTNGTNTEKANAIQGADVQSTRLWWAK